MYAAQQARVGDALDGRGQRRRAPVDAELLGTGHDAAVGGSQLAAQTLENAGFQVSQQYQTVTDPSQDNIVQRQSPSGGTQAPKGSTVTITIGQYTPGPGTTTSTTTQGQQ